MNEDIVRACPLCGSDVRLFFINLNEKLLMCENTTCEYPFGYEELQFFKEDNEIESDMEVVSVSGLCKGSTSTSVVSAAAWSDIDKINRVYDSEDSQFEVKSFDVSEHCPQVMQDRIVNDDEILKNVKEMKGLSMELQSFDDKSEVIKNEKWIKNLMSLQGFSGVQLLKQQEIEQLKKEEPYFGDGELKIDIDTNTYNMSSIKIEITNRNDNVKNDNVTNENYS